MEKTGTDETHTDCEPVTGKIALILGSGPQMRATVAPIKCSEIEGEKLGLERKGWGEQIRFRCDPPSL